MVLLLLHTHCCYLQNHSLLSSQRRVAAPRPSPSSEWKLPLVEAVDSLFTLVHGELRQKPVHRWASSPAHPCLCFCLSFAPAPRNLQWGRVDRVWPIVIRTLKEDF
ncbi:unnamed protein product [Pleuronectes platessa]|uniref:Uncharacterized protein n=1 Tax=Pleuronectes platessa TaxID=8262 RepID=A0A9N7Z0D8_PLEPL|nr:unnamed protein product [Pleuronectes platessa]